MRRIVEVIESRVWMHKDGRTTSVYGAVPYINQHDKTNWTVVVRGYTWRCSDGTIGLGRQPVKTRLEAIIIMDKINSL